MKKFFLILALAVCALSVVSAQEPAASHDGGISPEMLAQISATYEDNGYDRAISNALAGTSISVLAVNADNAAMIAIAGWYHYMNGERASLDVAPVSRLAEF